MSSLILLELNSSSMVQGARRWDFITIVAEVSSYTTWCAIWMPPPQMTSAPWLRFRVQTLRNHDLCSPAFQPLSFPGLIGRGSPCEP